MTHDGAATDVEKRWTRAPAVGRRARWRLMSFLGVAVAMELLGWQTRPVHAAPFAYVVESSTSIAVLDTATLAVVARVPVGSGANGTAVHPAGTFVYVANYWDETVSVVDTATNSVVATVPVPPGPLSLAVHPAGTFVYVAHDGDFTVIDTATNRVRISFRVAGTFDAAARGIAVHPAGTHVYLSNVFFESVSAISTETYAIEATVTTATRPAGIAVHPKGTYVYAVNAGFALGPGNMGGHNLSVIDARTNDVAATVPIGGLPFGVAVHPDGTFVYVTDGATQTSRSSPPPPIPWWRPSRLRRTPLVSRCIRPGHSCT